MATTASRNALSRKVYYVEDHINFATDAAAKGSALAANDVIQAITVPAGSMILNAGMQVVTPAVGESADLRLDLGVTGIDADVFVDGFDYAAAAAGAWTQNPAAFQPVVVGPATDTIDILIQAATTAPTAGIVRVWAVLMDISDRGIAVTAARDTSTL